MVSPESRQGGQRLSLLFSRWSKDNPDATSPSPFRRCNVPFSVPRSSVWCPQTFVSPEFELGRILERCQYPTDAASIPRWSPPGEAQLGIDYMLSYSGPKSGS